MTSENKQKPRVIVTAGYDEREIVMEILYWRERGFKVERRQGYIILRSNPDHDS